MKKGNGDLVNVNIVVNANMVVSKIEEETQLIIKLFNSFDKENKDAFKERLDITGLFCYYNKSTGTIDYSSKLKDKFKKQLIKLNY